MTHAELLLRSVPVLLLHGAPAVGAHPHRQREGSGRLAGLGCAIPMVGESRLRRPQAIFATLAAAQEAAVAGCVRGSLVEAEREGGLVGRIAAET